MANSNVDSAELGGRRSSTADEVHTMGARLHALETSVATMDTRLRGMEFGIGDLRRLMEENRPKLRDWGGILAIVVTLSLAGFGAVFSVISLQTQAAISPLVAADAASGQERSNLRGGIDRLTTRLGELSESSTLQTKDLGRLLSEVESLRQLLQMTQARVAAVEGRSEGADQEIRARLIEIETQFCAMDNIREEQRGALMILIDQLWVQAGRSQLRDVDFAPKVGRC